jgi:hypothetical protein
VFRAVTRAVEGVSATSPRVGTRAADVPTKNISATRGELLRAAPRQGGAIVVSRNLAAIAVLWVLAGCGGGGSGGAETKPPAIALPTLSLSSVSIGNGSATFGIGVGITSVPTTAFGDYKIACAAGGTTVNATTAPTTTVQVVGLSNGTQYACRAIATSKDLAYLDSAPSEAVSVTPIALASGTSAVVLTGQFIDAPVSGLTFSTRTQSGKTDAGGFFKYLQGEVVEFAIGGQRIGSSIGQTMVHVYDLVAPGFTAPTPSTSVQIAQVLQSLNSTTNTAALITINPLASTWLATGGLPIGSSTANLSAAFSTLVPSNVSLVSEAAATLHINNYLPTIASSYETTCGVPRQTYKLDSISDGKITLIDATPSTFTCYVRSQVAAYKAQIQPWLSDELEMLFAQASVFDQAITNEQQLIDQTGLSIAVRRLGYAVDTLDATVKINQAKTTMEATTAIVNGSLTLVDKYVQQSEYGKTDKTDLNKRIKLAQVIISTLTNASDCTQGKDDQACSKAIISAMKIVEPSMALVITENPEALLALQNLGSSIKLIESLADAKGEPGKLKAALLKYAAEFLRIQGTLMLNAAQPNGSDWRASLTSALSETSASVDAYFECKRIIDLDVGGLRACYDGVVVRGVNNLAQAVFRVGMLWSLLRNNDEVASVFLVDAILREYLAAGGDMDAVFASRSISVVNSTPRCLFMIGCSSNGILSEKAKFSLLLDQLKGKGTWGDSIPLDLTWNLFTRTIQSLRTLADFYERSGGFSVVAERTTGSLSANIVVTASSAQVDSVACTATGANPSSFTITPGTPKTQNITYSKTGAYRVACLGYRGGAAIFSRSTAVSLLECSTGEELKFGVCVRPSVTEISPTTAVAGQASTFTVTGKNLPLTAVLSLADGSCGAPTNRTTTGFAVLCTPGTSTGSRVVTIGTAATGGTVIDATRTITITAAPLSTTTFLDNFDAAALDPLKWSVGTAAAACCGAGNPATYLVTGGHLNITVPGGSCGFCGVPDGSIFSPRVSALTGDFEVYVSFQEISRTSRDGTGPMNTVSLELSNGATTAGVYVVGDVLNNSGTRGHAIYAYAAGAILPAGTRNLSVGQFYSLEFRVRRVSGVFYLAHKVAGDVNWTETSYSGAASLLGMTPKFISGAGDGGGTRTNSSSSIRVDSFSIKQ